MDNRSTIITDVFDYANNNGCVRFNDNNKKRLIVVRNSKSGETRFIFSKHNEPRISQVSKNDGIEYNQVVAGDCNNTKEMRRYLYCNMRQYKCCKGNKHIYYISDEMFIEIIQDIKSSFAWCYTSNETAEGNKRNRKESTTIIPNISKMPSGRTEVVCKH